MNNLLGLYLTKGKTRKVYLHANNNEWIVKLLRKNNKTINNNITEWNFWNVVKGTEFEIFFCPCIDLLNNKYLIMNRCHKPISKFRIKSILGIKIPDLKPENLGLLNGRTVILDYGHPGYNTIAKTIEAYKNEQTR